MVIWCAGPLVHEDDRNVGRFAEVHTSLQRHPLASAHLPVSEDFVSHAPTPPHPPSPASRRAGRQRVRGGSASCAGSAPSRSPPPPPPPPASPPPRFRRRGRRPAALGRSRGPPA